MDIVNTILNIAAPPISLITFVIFYPSLLFFRLLLYITKSFFSEDVAGKVVLITGASSGIGEHVAYEYAKRGACLALVARRHHLLQEVAETARYLGSPDVLVIPLQYKSSFEQDTDSNDQKTSCVGRKTRCWQDD